MAECKNTDGTKGKNVSGAFPDRNAPGNNPGGLQISEVEHSVFDTYALLSATQNYAALNNALNKLVGLDVRWFRAVPQQRSQDVIFQEYTLSNVEDEPACLKVVLPDGNFPDSKYNYDLMGLEYEVPLEIHVDKLYWENIVGDSTAPQKNDIVYFVIPNKLYEVVSSYLFRGFMEQETTWKITLRKYQPQASRKEGDNLKETIDKYTVSADEIFGEKLDSDVKKLTDDKQMSPFNSTSRDEYKVLDTELYVANSKLDIYGIIVSESFYDLNTSKYFNAVCYNGIDKITTSKDRSLTSWIMIDPGVVQEYQVTNITNPDVLTYPANYIISVSTRKEQFKPGDNMEIYRPGSLNFYAEIITVPTAENNLDGYEVKIDQPVIDHLSSIKTNWADQKNYKMKIQSPVSIIDGINDASTNTGWKVDIYSNQYVKINYGTQEYISIISNKLYDKEWYGVVINIGNTWSQYNVHLYKIHPSDSTTKLESIFYETLELEPEEIEVGGYTINKGPSYLRNLRLYNSTIEEEKQMEDLLSYFVKDGDQLVLNDSTNSSFNGPYIGAQR